MHLPLADVTDVVGMPYTIRIRQGRLRAVSPTSGQRRGEGGGAFRGPRNILLSTRLFLRTRNTFVFAYL